MEENKNLNEVLLEVAQEVKETVDPNLNVVDLPPMEQDAGKLNVGAVLLCMTGIGALIVLIMWLVKKHKKRKALQEIQDVADEEWDGEEENDEQEEEPVEEEPKPVKKRTSKKKKASEEENEKTE